MTDKEKEVFRILTTKSFDLYAFKESENYNQYICICNIGRAITKAEYTLMKEVIK